MWVTHKNMKGIIVIMIEESYNEIDSCPAEF